MTFKHPFFPSSSSDSSKIQQAREGGEKAWSHSVSLRLSLSQSTANSYIEKSFKVVNIRKADHPPPPSPSIELPPTLLLPDRKQQPFEHPLHLLRTPPVALQSSGLLLLLHNLGQRRHPVRRRRGRSRRTRTRRGGREGERPFVEGRSFTEDERGGLESARNRSGEGVRSFRVEEGEEVRGGRGARWRSMKSGWQSG
ncbi:hypothetical protein BDY24DRAFT_405371 [Mrakia frigida]|uniref:uncharacterized protein n=1 Tax=Mrakia frigida TaxID=29902 RepID=UPI003FCBF209